MSVLLAEWNPPLVAPWEPLGTSEREQATDVFGPRLAGSTRSEIPSDLNLLKRDILWKITKSPGIDSETIAEVLGITDKLASDLTTEMAREGLLEIA